MIRLFKVALVCALVWAIPSAGGAGAAGSQMTVFDATQAAGPSKYFQPAPPALTNYVSPINYAGGTAYWRLGIVDKPSTLKMNAQVCFWRSNYHYETCSPLRTGITSEGTYWVNLGAPAGWWKKGGNYSWATKPDVVRIMLKDAASGRLLMSSSCGAYCYPRGDLSSHVPITIDSELIFVAKGSTLTPPSNWVGGCPTTWSAQCSGTSGGGGGTGGGTVPTVSISDGSVVEPDTGYKSLPFKLTLSQAASTDVQVTVNIRAGTATAGVDFDTRRGAVVMTIPKGQTTAWVGFAAYGDTIREANETVFTSLTSPSGATLGRASATGVIVNDD